MNAIDDSLSDVVNMINRRAIEWGCDITHIYVTRDYCNRLT